MIDKKPSLEALRNFLQELTTSLFRICPQTPKPPFSYQSIEVTFDNSLDKEVRLAGTLTIPVSNSPLPAVILCLGSGPVDRDETMDGHKPFAVIADYLTKRGIACLRFDKRGIGKSKGDYLNATTIDFASDVVAGMKFLETCPEIDPKCIGLIGHSEGALIAPLVAIEPQNNISFIVLLAAPCIPYDRHLYASAEHYHQDNPKEYDKVRKFLDIAIPIVKQGGELVDLIDNLVESCEKIQPWYWYFYPKFIKRFQLLFWVCPWLGFIMNYDPAVTLSKCSCPTLVINGEKDSNVLSAIHLPAIHRQLESGLCRDYEVVEVSNMNHMLQTCKTGSVKEYKRIRETVVPIVLEKIEQWIQMQVKKI
jgi:uncharacterized protein